MDTSMTGKIRTWPGNHQQWKSIAQSWPRSCHVWGLSEYQLLELILYWVNLGSVKKAWVNLDWPANMWAEWTLVEWLMVAKAVIDKELVYVHTRHWCQPRYILLWLTNVEIMKIEKGFTRGNIGWKRRFKWILTNCVWKDKEWPFADKFPCSYN